MAKFNLTNKAVQDLSAIWNYTFDVWSERQADFYYEMLIASCQEIADNPLLGRSYEIIARNVFGYRVGRYIIFYKIISEEEIEVVRILHGRMDLKSRI